jgi:hypothetical protein
MTIFTACPSYTGIPVLKEDFDNMLGNLKKTAAELGLHTILNACDQ